MSKSEPAREAWQRKRAEKAEAENERLRAVLGRITEVQPEVLDMCARNGFVFDSIGNEPGNWQHLAFTIYTELCEVDSVARAALSDEGAP